MHCSDQRKLRSGRPVPGLSEGSGGVSVTTEPGTEGEAERRMKKRGINSPEEGNRSKRSRESENDSGEEEGDDDPLISLGYLLRKIRKFWMQPTIRNMLKNAQKFEKYLDAYQEELIKA